MSIKEEFDAIVKHQLFGVLVEDSDGRNASPGHSVYKIAHDEAGNVQLFMARLGCGGNHQTETIDYHAIYVMIHSLRQARLALMIAANYDFDIHHMNIWTAFFAVDLEAEF
jgi:hypothetical protein